LSSPREDPWCFYQIILEGAYLKEPIWFSLEGLLEETRVGFAIAIIARDDYRVKVVQQADGI
jgi:hypothetical protein